MSNGNKFPNQDDNFEILVNKVDSLEKSLLTEKDKSRNLEEELNNYKDYKIPLLSKTIKEKEDYIDSLLIEQIKLQKEINYLKDNYDENNLKLLNTSKYVIPEFQEEKDKIIIFQTNKLDYLNNVYRQLKNKFNEKEEEFETKIKEFN